MVLLEFHALDCPRINGGRRVWYVPLHGLLTVRTHLPFNVAWRSIKPWS